MDSFWFPKLFPFPNNEQYATDLRDVASNRELLLNLKCIQYIISQIFIER